MIRDAVERLADALKRMRQAKGTHRNGTREHFRNPRVIAKLAKQAEQKPWVPVMQRKRQGGRV